MMLELIRLRRTKDAILGCLYAHGNRMAHTLESVEHAIPAGTYPVTLYQSPRFKRTVPLLHDVPGRSMIEIHAGNTVKDTKGCILVGEEEGWTKDDNDKYKSEAAIWNSRAALDNLVLGMRLEKEPYSIKIEEGVVTLG